MNATFQQMTLHNNLIRRYMAYETTSESCENRNVISSSSIITKRPKSKYNGKCLTFPITASNPQELSSTTKKDSYSLRAVEAHGVMRRQGSPIF
jgi:hypothetical protein